MSVDLPGRYEDDNGWHEILSIAPPDRQPGTDQTFAAFIDRCTAIVRCNDEPRIRYEVVVMSAESAPGEPVPAVAWFAAHDGAWMGAHTDVDDEKWFDAVDPEQDLPTPRTRPIADIPAVGLLRDRMPAFPPGSGTVQLLDQEQDTPAAITISAEQIRERSGRALTADQLTRFHTAVANSCIPEAIATIVEHM